MIDFGAMPDLSSPDFIIPQKSPALLAAERKRDSRAKGRAEGRKLHPYRKPRGTHGMFMGVDGEGAGTDELGRQHFLLLRAGDAELFNDNRPLRTADCLEFLCSLPRKPVLVGFAFGYDATMILRDLDRERLDHLFMSQADKQKAGIQFRYTYWQDYAIEYLPKQYFRVARVKNNEIVKNSSRTVYETFGFFQSSFMAALKRFDIGREHWAEIERNKQARRDFTTMDRTVRRYCRLECELLADLMTSFRETCLAADIKPRTWNGAGKLAASLHTSHGTIRRDALGVPPGLLQVASTAYYGGRFEITRTGQIEGPIHEYDIRSAYPAAMQSLPCLHHGEWRRADHVDASGSLFVAEVSFRHDRRMSLCGFPIRTKQSRLFWPRQGRGTYWSVEIDAARALGADITLGEGWTYERQCDCQPFDWVRGLYDYRRSIGSGAKGYPIKLGINSLYGQLARRVGGGGPWSNHIWAGLITAWTRAQLMRAAAQAPHDILMLATDGIYSRVPLDLPIGEELGQWEHATHPAMFAVQPGLYWGPPKPKTRGISSSVFTPHIGRFEAAWQRFGEEDRAAVKLPREMLFDMENIGFVRVPLVNFIGAKLAWSRGKPETSGVWKEDSRRISFDWSLKRRVDSARWEGGAMRHWPHDGASDLVSCAYAWQEDSVSMAMELASLSEGMPDFMEFSAPGFE